MQDSPVSDFAIARRNMVEGQIRPFGINDLRILTAMGTIPRESFVPFTHVNLAYIDENIRLLSNRFLMKPAVIPRLLQAPDIQTEDHVLELAPATGYSTIIISALTPFVSCVEPDSVLHKEAEKNVATYAPGKAVVLAGAPVEGCVVRAPFNVIVINGSVEFLPDFLFDQLDEGGRLVTIVRTDAPGGTHTGQARLYRKTKDAVSWTPLFETSAPPAPGFVRPHGFTF